MTKKQPGVSSKRPMVMDHQPIRFETAQSWNPGQGNQDHPGHGNGGVNFPPNNPNRP
ncbi:MULTISPECIES: hypothetical protein [Priestia]|nr:MULTISPECIES: hypothetical protein [Priestia]MBX4160881.1 hypothetical protein [Priestia megaterium]MCM3253539.1 hypothetical protein [Priestia aryabhattai]MCQ9284503.1 hypothetical protein [Priestia aryabhattai]MED3894929.1 hypothetical protein [Priestia aryabhattai]